MSFNGSGVFTRLYSWVADAANSIPITATRMDPDSNDIAQGLTNCVTRDGQSPATANLPMGGFKFTNCANAVAGNEFTTLSQSGALYQPVLGYTPVNKAGDTLTGALSMTTTTPAARFSFQSNTGSGFVGQSGGAAQFEVLSFSNENLVFGTANTQAAYFDTSQRFSIGSTDAASGLFNINGGRSFFAGNAEVFSVGLAFNTARRVAGQVVYVGATNAASPDFVVSNVAGTEIARVTSVGNVTIPGTGTGVNWIGTSDARLKYNVAMRKPRDDLADSVQFVSFQWNRDSRNDIGVIAQQVREVAPEYVHEAEDGTLGVDKASLALEMIMGLASRVRALEGR